MVVIAVAPHAHQMAFYPGADVSPAIRAGRHPDAAAALAASGLNGGVVAMGRRPRPTWVPYGMTVSGSASSVQGAGAREAWSAHLLSERAQCPSSSKSSRPLYAQVTHDYDSTALRVGTLEPGSPESHQLAQRYQRSRPSMTTSH